MNEGATSVINKSRMGLVVDSFVCPYSKPFSIVLFAHIHCPSLLFHLLMFIIPLLCLSSVGFRHDHGSCFSHEM